MTGRIDHAAEARKILELVTGLPKLDEARVHATLALVEQQRIATLVQLAEVHHDAQARAALWPDPAGPLAPDVAAALGINNDKETNE